MAKRKIIEIDRDRCDGCGLCTKACAEGALILDKDNKAVLVKEIFCDGMGACLDVCPAGALKIVEKESEFYDAQAAHGHVLKTQGAEAAKKMHGATKIHAANPAPQGCPGSMAKDIQRPSQPPSGEKTAEVILSELRQWPIQLHLISPQAPYFQGCDLLVAADCTAFAIGSFHRDLLKGKKVVIACPKLDETEGYVKKLAQLFKQNTVYSITVVIMEVPCCSELFRIVQEALELSGSKMPIKKIVIGLDGSIRA